MGLLRNNKDIRSELNTAIAEVVDETIKDKQADSTIRRPTLCTVGSESFVKDLSQCIVEDNKFVTSFTTHTKRHVDKAMDTWQATKNLAKTVAKLSDSMHDVAKASEQEPGVHAETSRIRCSRS